MFFFDGQLRPNQYTKPIYAAFANENTLNYPPSRMSGSAT